MERNHGVPCAILTQSASKGNRCPGRVRGAMVKYDLAAVEAAAEELTDVRYDYLGYHRCQPIAGASLSRKIVGGGLVQKLLAEAVQQRARSVITEAANRRRVELVRKSNRGTLSGDEAAELGRLQIQIDEGLERWDQELLAELGRMEKAVEDLPAHGN